MLIESLAATINKKVKDNDVKRSDLQQGYQNININSIHLKKSSLFFLSGERQCVIADLAALSITAARRGSSPRNVVPIYI